MADGPLLRLPLVAFSFANLADEEHRREVEFVKKTISKRLENDRNRSLAKLRQSIGDIVVIDKVNDAPAT